MSSQGKGVWTWGQNNLYQFNCATKDSTSATKNETIFPLPPRSQQVSSCRNVRSIERLFGLQIAGTTLLIRSVDELPDSQSGNVACVND